MARTIRDISLGTRNARLKLAANGNPYWRHIEEGLHLGYRRLSGRSGSWWCRTYIGGQKYNVESIGAADDLSDADGIAVLSFEQAQRAARQKLVSRAHAVKGKPPTVASAMTAYIEYLGSEKKTAADAAIRNAAFIEPELGEIEVHKLTTERIRTWLYAMAKKPARLRTPKGQPQRYRDMAGAEAVRRRKSSANRSLTVLRAALNRVFEDGKVSTDIEWRRVKPFRSVDSARIKYLTVAEARRLVNASDPDFRLLVRAALETGARYGELANLKVRDFSADSGTLAMATSKSGKPRYITLTDSGVKYFKQICAGRSGDKLMLTKATGEPWTKSNQARPMRRACEVAKIKPINFHALRHSWAKSRRDERRAAGGGEPQPRPR